MPGSNVPTENQRCRSIRRKTYWLPTNIVLYFECGDLDGRVSELKAAGLTFDEDPTDRPWLWRQAYLKDPNGNKICMFNAGENRKNPPWRVK